MMEYFKHLKIFNKIHAQQPLCSACNQLIRKHIVKCSGPCERNFHQNCIIYDEFTFLKSDSRSSGARKAINLCEKCEHTEQNLMMRVSSLNQHLKELIKLDNEIKKFKF